VLTLFLFWVTAFGSVVILTLLAAMYVKAAQNDERSLVILVAAFFVCLAVPMSFFLIWQHLHYFTSPHLQRYVVRILLMVPIYAVDAFVALRFVDAAPALDAIRELYEAYVIYNFLRLLEDFTGDEQTRLEALSHHPPVKHISPFCFLAPWPAEDLSYRIRVGSLQYVLVRSVSAIVTFILNGARAYGYGRVTINAGYFWVTILCNFSQAWALYCLALFHRAFREQLAPLRPVLKFACVKTVIFMTFWQGVAIVLLVQFGWIRRGLSYSRDDVAQGLQDFLVCIEVRPPPLPTQPHGLS